MYRNTSVNGLPLYSTFLVFLLLRVLYDTGQHSPIHTHSQTNGRWWHLHTKNNNHLKQFGFQYHQFLTQGHFNMQTGGVQDQTTDRWISRLPPSSSWVTATLVPSYQKPSSRTTSHEHLVKIGQIQCPGASCIKLCVECLRSYKWGKVRAPKNIQIYKTWRTPVCAQLPFINPKSTWKRMQVDQPRDVDVKNT